MPEHNGGNVERWEHLKQHQFRPGVSGNPGGRRKGHSITPKLRNLLAATTYEGTELPEGKTVADLVAAVIVKRALKGDHRLLDLLLNRVEGKVADRVKFEAVVPDGEIPRLIPKLIDPRYADGGGLEGEGDGQADGSAGG